MLFGLLILLLIAVVAYYHWIQGVFSATISAILSFAAAMLAFGWHEWVVDLTLKGKMGDQAHAAVLAALYALVYITLRFLFDGLVPGNVRVPALVDKIGGAAMGVIAGIFATGILVIAAQELPFGPAILDYSRFETKDAGVTVVKGGRQDQEAPLEAVVSAPNLDAKYASGMFIPVDDIVVGTVRALSEGGALAGPRALADYHPDFLNELFGQRIGLQPGSLHSAFSAPGQQQVTIKGAYRIDSAPQVDSEAPDAAKKLQEHYAKLPSRVAEDFKTAWNLTQNKRATRDTLLLIIRVEVDANVSDSTNMVALSPGAVCLTASRANYHPIGTYQNGKIYRNRIDDPIFVPVAGGAAGSADFVFEVKAADVAATDAKKTSLVFQPGVFLTVKRLSRLPLTGVIKNQVDAAPANPPLLKTGAKP